MALSHLWDFRFNSNSHFFLVKIENKQSSNFNVSRWFSPDCFSYFVSQH